MAELRLYRDIICLTQNAMLEQSTQMIDPVSISAYTSGNTGVIETLTPINSEVGRYYVEIDPIQYNTQLVYMLFWEVKYTSESPIKNLITRFKIVPKISLGESVDIEIANNIIEIEIV